MSSYGAALVRRTRRTAALVGERLCAGCAIGRAAPPRRPLRGRCPRGGGAAGRARFLPLRPRSRGQGCPQPLALLRVWLARYCVASFGSANCAPLCFGAAQLGPSPCCPPCPFLAGGGPRRPPTFSGSPVSGPPPMEAFRRNPPENEFISHIGEGDLASMPLAQPCHSATKGTPPSASTAAFGGRPSESSGPSVALAAASRGSTDGVVVPRCRAHGAFPEPF